jgi:hypothetical protein
MDLNHPSQPQLVEAGREAVIRGAWEEARSAFERAVHRRVTLAYRSLTWPLRGLCQMLENFARY